MALSLVHDYFTIRASMEECHENLKTAPISATRRQQLYSELKQLRGLLGSLHWLVTQVHSGESKQFGAKVRGALRHGSLLSTFLT